MGDPNSSNPVDSIKVKLFFVINTIFKKKLKKQIDTPILLVLNSLFIEV